MPGITVLIISWWKQILLVMILSLLAVGIITFLKPLQWLSVSSALPTSSVASDKSKIFNENIQGLYSALGGSDDLDMILGTAKLDTVYLTITDQFNLYDHYKIKGKPEIIRVKAAEMLKKNCKVMKSEYGELKVKVWDTDKNLAPQLANALMELLQLIHTNIKNAGNNATLMGLQLALKKIKDSAGTGNDQVLQYTKLIGEYQLMVDSKPPALVIVEKAKASLKPDRPKRLEIMLATAFLSFLFSLLAVLILERRKIFRS